MISHVIFVINFFNSLAKRIVTTFHCDCSVILVTLVFTMLQNKSMPGIISIYIIAALSVWLCVKNRARLVKVVIV